MKLATLSKLLDFASDRVVAQYVTRGEKLPDNLIMDISHILDIDTDVMFMITGKTPEDIARILSQSDEAQNIIRKSLDKIRSIGNGLDLTEWEEQFPKEWFEEYIWDPESQELTKS